jgi:hypothetical protein
VQPSRLCVPTATLAQPSFTRNGVITCSFVTNNVRAIETETETSASPKLDVLFRVVLREYLRHSMASGAEMASAVV